MKKAFDHINIYTSDVNPNRCNTIEFVLEDNKFKNMLLLYFGELGAVCYSRFDDKKVAYIPKTPKDFIKLLSQTTFDYNTNSFNIVDVHPACLLAHDYKNKKMCFIKDPLENGFDELMNFAVNYFQSPYHNELETNLDVERFEAVCREIYKKHTLKTSFSTPIKKETEEDQM